MKSLFFLTVISLFILISFQLPAQEEPDERNVWTGGQKGYVVTGDLTVLKNEKTFNISITPQIQKMGSAEEPDTVYIAKRVKEWNEEKAGSGDQWLSDWNEAKKNFKPAFIEGLNVRLSKIGVNIGPDDTSTEFTFVIYTKNLMEFWGGIYIILDMDVVNTKDPDIKTASIRFPVNNSSPKSKQFTRNYERAYYAAGLLFGKYLVKNIYQ